MPALVFRITYTPRAGRPLEKRFYEGEKALHAALTGIERTWGRPADLCIQLIASHPLDVTETYFS